LDFSKSCFKSRISSYLNITPAQLATTVTAVNAYTDAAVASLGNTASNTYVPLSDVGNIDGVASLDATGKIPDSQIPAGITRDTELSSAISTAISNLIDGAPGALDTLNELAAAINDDSSYASTITSALGLKAPLASPALTGTPTAPTAAADTNTTQIATTAFAKAEADAAQAAAATDATDKVAAEAALRVSGDAASVSTASTDATTKANAAQAAAISAAATDATTKADAAQAAAISAAATDATTKANAAQAAAISAAATDATTKANAAQAAAISAAATDATTKADAAQAAAATDATTKANAAQAAAISAAATDATTKANAAKTGAEATAAAALSSHESDTTNIHGIADTSLLATKSYADSAASAAVAAVIDTAPAALDTLNELAAALGDDANFATTITTSIGTKAPIDSPTFTGTVSGITKSMVGLGSVDNTTDADKPVSTATQTALNLKANLASPTFTGTVVFPDNTITNAMLAGSIANNKLANSSITINGSAVSLGGSVTLATGNAATESTLGTVYGKVTLAGVDNTSLGSLTLQNTETGILNTAVGNESLRTLSSGERNTVIGYQAGTLIETGSDNTLLGTNAGNTLLGGTNNIIIGSNAQAPTNSTSNEIIIGNGSNTSFKIPGIGLLATATDYIITATSAQNLTNKTLTSPTIVSPIFQGPISVFNPTDDSHAVNKGYLVAELADAVGSDIYPLDSLSQLFDGYTSRFKLKFDGVDFIPTNPYKLLITINGIIQILGNQDQHWLSALPSEGYFLDNDGYIQFGEPIPAGSSFEAKYISGPNTQTVKKSRYPFRATDILLGD